MDDDWRLQVDFNEEKHVRHLLEQLGARELEYDLSDAFHDRAIVSRDGGRVFLYAGTREQAESAGKLVDRLAAEHGWNRRGPGQSTRRADRERGAGRQRRQSGGNLEGSAGRAPPESVCIFGGLGG